MIDARTGALGGEPTWFRTDLRAYSKPWQFKKWDWLQLSMWAGDYVFHDLYPDHPERMNAIYGFLDCIRGIVGCTSTADDLDDTAIGKLETKIVEALCQVETEFPDTELSVLLHVMLHIPAAIRRWNSVRNFWCFWTERYNPNHF